MHKENNHWYDKPLSIAIISCILGSILGAVFGGLVSIQVSKKIVLEEKSQRINPEILITGWNHSYDQNSSSVYIGVDLLVENPKFSQRSITIDEMSLNAYMATSGFYAPMFIDHYISMASSYHGGFSINVSELGDSLGNDVILELVGKELKTKLARYPFSENATIRKKGTKIWEISTEGWRKYTVMKHNGELEICEIYSSTSSSNGGGGYLTFTEKNVKPGNSVAINSKETMQSFIFPETNRDYAIEVAVKYYDSISVRPPLYGYFEVHYDRYGSISDNHNDFPIELTMERRIG